MEEKLRKLLPWIPLLIAAGYFMFLIGTWQRFTASQQRNQELFDRKVEEWLASQKKAE